MDIYFDNSATTKPYPEIIQIVTDMLTNKYGNPSSIHRLGMESKQEIEKAREMIAQTLKANADEIYFTSGGTEGNNLAIKGACLGNQQIGKKIVTTVAEHPSVTKTIRDLKRQGWKVEYIPALNGELDIEKMEQAIDDETVLVSAMLVNNETGCIFPIKKIREIIECKQISTILHCDAVQAYGKIPFTVESLGVDLLTISAHKIHGPKGVGALYVKKGTNMFSLHLGGGQERGLRSGTECTPLIPAFGKAAQKTIAHMDQNVPQMKKLRDYLIDELTRKIPEAVIHSTKEGAPHIVNFSLPGKKNEEVVRFLSERGIYISSAAACKSNHKRGPSVLESLGISRELASSSLRVSFSYLNTKDEIDQLLLALMDYSQ